MNEATDQRRLEIVTENGLIVTSELTDKTLQFLATASSGMLIEEIGGKLKAAIFAMSDNEDPVEKADITIKISMKKSKDHSQLFSSKTTVKLALPDKKYEDSFFANADGTPSKELNKQTIHHSRG